MTSVWQFLLHPSLGPIDAVIKWFGFEPLAFLSEPKLLIPTMALIGIWQVLGFNMVLFLAGLTSIPDRSLRGGSARWSQASARPLL